VIGEQPADHVGSSYDLVMRGREVSTIVLSAIAPRSPRMSARPATDGASESSTRNGMAYVVAS
jgi:hypothetical protein